ncbi:MAG: YiiD C-terminal domain-containing protein [Isosphaeraceae bacterium]
MDVTALPFNQMIGLQAEDVEGGWLVSLPASREYDNHLGTVHAAALLAVAEAGSAVALLRHLGEAEGYVPVVRRLESKFHNPARGRVAARGTIPPEEVARASEALGTRGRVRISVAVEVVDESGTVAMSAVVEWFITSRARA